MHITFTPIPLAITVTWRCFTVRGWEIQSVGPGHEEMGVDTFMCISDTDEGRFKSQHYHLLPIPLGILLNFHSSGFLFCKIGAIVIDTLHNCCKD